MTSAARLCGEPTELTAPNLRAAAAYSAAHGGLSLLVIQNNRVVFEQYDNGHASEKTWKIYSGTKAFWTIAAVAAEEDGILRIDERASDTIKEWRNNPAKRTVTIRELLNFTGGLSPGFPLHSERIRDRNQYALELPMVTTPGERFIYGPSQLQVFCEVLRRKLATRNETPWGYLEHRILNPIGLYNIKYRHDETGTPLLATGFELTARDWAKFGLLVLGRGSYHGKRIISSESLESCMRGSGANPAFGLAFWLNRRAPDAREFDIEEMLENDWKKQDWYNACICQKAPADLLACVGSQYQRLFIFPSLNAVVVRQGNSDTFKDGRFLRLLLGR